jgi:hypothetical protein
VTARAAQAMVAKLGLRKMTERRAVSGLGNDTDQAAGGLTKGGLFDGKHNKGIFDLLWHAIIQHWLLAADGLSFPQ